MTGKVSVFNCAVENYMNHPANFAFKNQGKLPQNFWQNDLVSKRSKLKPASV